MPEDATKALEELATINFPEGKEGNPLTMAFALRKRKEGEENVEERKGKGKKEGILSGKKKEDRGKAEEDKDPLAERTLLIRNLPASVSRKQLNVRVRRYGKVVDLAIDDVATEDTNTKEAQIIFEEENVAAKARANLHGHEYKGATLDVRLLSEPDRVCVCGVLNAQTPFSPLLTLFPFTPGK